MTVAFLANVAGLFFMVTFLAHFTFSFRFISFFPLYSREWHDSLGCSVAVNHFCSELGSQCWSSPRFNLQDCSLHELYFSSVFTLLCSRNCLGSQYLVWQSLGPRPVSLRLIFKTICLFVVCVHANVWKSGSQRAKEGKSLFFFSQHVLPTQLVRLGSWSLYLLSHLIHLNFCSKTKFQINTFSLPPLHMAIESPFFLKNSAFCKCSTSASALLFQTLLFLFWNGIFSFLYTTSLHHENYAAGSSVSFYTVHL